MNQIIYVYKIVSFPFLQPFAETESSAVHGPFSFTIYFLKFYTHSQRFYLKILNGIIFDTVSVIKKHLVSRIDFLNTIFVC